MLPIVREDARPWGTRNTHEPSLAQLFESGTLRPMQSDVIETLAHTTPDGKLNLSLDVGVADADVTVTVRVTPKPSADADANGWPKGFFEQVAGSMPDIEGAPQDEFEERLPLEGI
jgi:hypothetical protein